MGIINITPDSFYDGSRVRDIESLKSATDTMVAEGADMLDVGAYSSRPGAQDIGLQEELDRLMPHIEWLSKNTTLPISVDTFRAKVAKEALAAGAHLINDISAGDDDEEMLPLIAETKVPYVLMHKKGNPQTMIGLSEYNNVALEVLEYFIKKKQQCLDLGITDLIIDPGFGFAKNIRQNFELLDNLNALQILDIPVLAGLSRKSLIYKSLGTTAENALNGTTALNMIALERGASILRVHDVAQAKECILLHQKLTNSR